MSLGTRVYIGRLSADVRKGDIEDLFRDYGRLQDVRIMGTFGFVEFEHPRDAEDAVKDFDGKNFMGDRIIVQHAKGPRKEADSLDRRVPPGYGDRFGGAPPPRREPRIRRGQFRITVTNLPPNTSWQDLKDIGREYGSISFADVDPSRDQGSIEYDNRDDYQNAMQKIDGTELRGFKLRVESLDNGMDRERSPARRRDDSPPRRRDDSPPRRRDDSPPRRRDDSPPRRREDSPPRRRDDSPRRDERDAGSGADGWGSPARDDEIPVSLGD